MNKFHQIPTDQFVPISHDNSYLFTHYDKISNFLAFNLDKNYKKLLAKPVQNGYVLDWFSIYEGLVNINEYKKAEADAGLIKYWDFIEVIKRKIEQLSNSTHDDGKNWASLLTKVFNQQDNFIFSNGKDISIVWGWKFDNNEIYKPDLRDKPEILPKLKTEADAADGEKDEKKTERSSPTVAKYPLGKKNPVEKSSETSWETNVQGDNKPLEELHTKKSFLEFLKWFAAKFWWLLWLLSLLIVIVFIIKAYNVNT